jgi:hypothetical protein
MILHFADFWTAAVEEEGKRQVAESFVSNCIEIIVKTVAPPPIQASFNSAAHY